MPNNFINLSLDRSSNLFEGLFYQRWSFFAPPPKYNEYLYYIFINKENNSTKAFEVIQPVNLRKQKEAPFNWKSEDLDYILSRAATGIFTEIRETNKYYEYENSNGVQSLTKDSINALVMNNIKQNNMYIAIKNYGKIVAKKNNIDLAKNFMVIRLTTKDIPKFTDRNKKEIVINEDICFQSEMITF